MKLQAPALLAVVVPSAFAPPSDTVTVAPSGAVPVSVTESLALTAPLLMTGAAGRRLRQRHRHIERARFRARPRRRRVGGGERIGAGRQVRAGEAPPPALLAVVVPSAVAPPSDTVTVAPSGAVPVSVTESLALTAPLLITGPPGLCWQGRSPPTCPARSIRRSSRRGRVGGIIPIDAWVKRRGREAPGAGAARGRGSVVGSRGAPHRHRRVRHAVPVSVMDSLGFSAMALITGAAGV